MKLLISPHNDDAVLFASFTLIRERPLVLTVLQSHVQPSRGYPNCEAHIRVHEDLQAITGVLKCPMAFLGFRDDWPDWAGIEAALRDVDPKPLEVYAPAYEIGGHEHHNQIALIADKVFGVENVRHYLTYTKAGKSVNSRPVEFQPAWVNLKLHALACYESQIALPNCVEHFLRPQHEYMLS